MTIYFGLTISLKEETHCVTQVDVSLRTSMRNGAHYSIKCDTTSCSEVTFVKGSTPLKEGNDLDYFTPTIKVMDGDEEGRSDDSCSGMVGNKVRMFWDSTALIFREVWILGGKCIFDEQRFYQVE